MASNPFTVVSNDTRAKRVTGVARHEMQEAQAGADTFDYILEDERGSVMFAGRGTTDRKVTYIMLHNTNGTRCFIYPNSSGTGLIVTPVNP